MRLPVTLPKSSFRPVLLSLRPVSRRDCRAARAARRLVPPRLLAARRARPALGLVGAPKGVAVGADPLQVVDDLDEVRHACLKALERVARHLRAFGAGGETSLGGTVAIPAVAAGERHSVRAAPIAGEAFLRPAERCGCRLVCSGRSDRLHSRGRSTHRVLFESRCSFQRREEGSEVDVAAGQNDPGAPAGDIELPEEKRR